MAKLLIVNKEILGIYYENFTIGIEMVGDTPIVMCCDIQFVVHVDSNFPYWVRDVQGIWNTQTTWGVSKLDLAFSRNYPASFITAKALLALGFYSHNPKPDEIEVKKFLIDEIKREDVDSSSATGCHMRWRKTPDF